MGFETIEAIRVAGSLGAEVRGPDLSQPLSDARFGELHDTLMSHRVVFLRDPLRSGEQQLDFSARFGEVAVSSLRR